MSEAQNIYNSALKAIKNKEDTKHIKKLLNKVIEIDPNSEFAQYASAQINNIEYQDNVGIKETEETEETDGFFESLIGFILAVLVIFFLIYLILLNSIH